MIEGVEPLKKEVQCYRCDGILVQDKLEFTCPKCQWHYKSWARHPVNAANFLSMDIKTMKARDDIESILAGGEESLEALKEGDREKLKDCASALLLAFMLKGMPKALTGRDS